MTERKEYMELLNKLRDLERNVPRPVSRVIRKKVMRQFGAGMQSGKERENETDQTG